MNLSPLLNHILQWLVLVINVIAILYSYRHKHDKPNMNRKIGLAVNIELIVFALLLVGELLLNPQAITTNQLIQISAIIIFIPLVIVPDFASKFPRNRYLRPFIKLDNHWILTGMTIALITVYVFTK